MSLSVASTPTRDEVLAELRAAMKSEFGLAPDEIQPATHLVDDLDLDSIDFVDLAVTLEESTGLKLEDDELSSVRTVEDAVEVVHAAFVRRGAGSA